MAQITQKITVEVAKPNLFQAIVAKQGDAKSRFLEVTLVDKGQTISINPTSFVTINAERPDGESKRFEGVANDGNTVTVPLAAWMLEQEGVVYCDVSVINKDEERVLTSTSFRLSVEKAACCKNDIVDDENYDILLRLIDETKEVTDSIKEEYETLKNAAANGEFDGDAATVEVGEITTVAYGQPAEVINKGTTTQAVLDFKIPRGEPGESLKIIVSATTLETWCKSLKEIGHCLARETFDYSFDYNGTTISGTMYQGYVYSFSKATLEITEHYDTIGADGKDGVSPEITVENQTDGVQITVDGESYFIRQGSDGETPVKGEDYFTEEDKSELVNDVLAALPTWEGGSY